MSKKKHIHKQLLAEQLTELIKIAVESGCWHELKMQFKACYDIGRNLCAEVKWKEQRATNGSFDIFVSCRKAILPNENFEEIKELLRSDIEALKPKEEQQPVYLTKNLVATYISADKISAEFIRCF